MSTAKTSKKKSSPKAKLLAILAKTPALTVTDLNIPSFIDPPFPTIAVTEVVQNYSKTQEGWRHWLSENMTTVPHKGIDGVFPNTRFIMGEEEISFAGNALSIDHGMILACMEMLTRMGLQQVSTREFPVCASDWVVNRTPMSSKKAIPIGAIDMIAWDSVHKCYVLVDLKTTSNKVGQSQRLLLKEEHLIQLHMYSMMLTRMASLAEIPDFSVGYHVILGCNRHTKVVSAWRCGINYGVFLGMNSNKAVSYDISERRHSILGNSLLKTNDDTSSAYVPLAEEDENDLSLVLNGLTLTTDTKPKGKGAHSKGAALEDDFTLINKNSPDSTPKEKPKWTPLSFPAFPKKK